MCSKSLYLILYSVTSRQYQISDSLNLHPCARILFVPPEQREHCKNDGDRNRGIVQVA